MCSTRIGLFFFKNSYSYLGLKKEKENTSHSQVIPLVPPLVFLFLLNLPCRAVLFFPLLPSPFEKTTQAMDEKDKKLIGGREEYWSGFVEMRRRVTKEAISKRQTVNMYHMYFNVINQLSSYISKHMHAVNSTVLFCF